MQTRDKVINSILTPSWSVGSLLLDRKLAAIAENKSAVNSVTWSMKKKSVKHDGMPKIQFLFFIRTSFFF